MAERRQRLTALGLRHDGTAGAAEMVTRFFKRADGPKTPRQVFSPPRTMQKSMEKRWKTKEKHNMNQGILEGFEEYDASTTASSALQEQATLNLIKSFMDGKTLTPEATYICKSMLSIARNIDIQNNKGREISRNMTSLLTWFQELKSMYPDQPQLDPTLADFIADAKAGL